MTARDFLAAALRRWYVVVLGAALTLGAFAVVQRQAPVFFTQYNIVVVGPSGTEHDDNVLENPRYGLQPLVGVVSTDLNDGHPPLLTGDVDATMVGDGRPGRRPGPGAQPRHAVAAALLGQLPRRAGGGRDARGGAGAGRGDLGPGRGAARAAAGRARGAAPTCAPTPSRRRRTPSSTPMPGSRSRALGGHRADRHRPDRGPGLLARALAPAPPPGRSARPLRPRDVRWCVGVPAPRR